MRTYFVVIGIVMLALSAWLYVQRTALAMRGVSARGRIEAYEARDDEDGTHYFPVVSFFDEQGRSRRFTARAGGADRKPPVGTMVVVRFLPGEPESACIQSFLQMWAAPLALAALGAGALLAAAV